MPRSRFGLDLLLGITFSNVAPLSLNSISIETRKIHDVSTFNLI